MIKKVIANNNSPLIFFAICSLSIICFGYLPKLPSLNLYLSISAILAVSNIWLLYKCMTNKGNTKQSKVVANSYTNIVTVLAAVMFAWVWAIGWGLVQMQERLPAEWENQNLLVEGYVVGVPRHHIYDGDASRNNNRSIFNFRVSKIVEAPKTQIPEAKLNLIRVSWYDSEAVVVPGQLWQFNLRMRRPFSFMNPGGFDYEAWNIRQGIDATAYIRGEAKLLSSSNKMWLDKQRWLVYEKLKNSKVPRTGFVSALMIGERGLLSHDENAIIRNTGIAHLLAISGLHLTLVGGGMFWLIFWLLGLARRLFNLQLKSTLTLAAQLALVFIWLYALWTGFSLPAQRAAIMLSVFMIALITKRFQSPTAIFFLAMTLVLMLDPLAFTSGGFYLSFAALAVVVMSFSYFIPRIKPDKIKALAGTRGRVFNYGFDLLVTQLVLLGGLLPLGLVFFNQFSLIGLLVNLIAIPITSFIIMPWVLLTNLLMFCLPGLADISLAGLGWLLDWLYALLALADSAPLAIITLANPNTLAIVAAFLAIPILIWWVKPYNIVLACAMLLPCLVPTVPDKYKIPHGEFSVHFMDVGQGLAVHLQTASHNLLYDTGASFSSGSNIGEITLVPYLREIGIGRLDALVVSHKDKDHSGGMHGIIDNIPVDKLILSFDYEQDHKNNPKLVLPCHDGDTWQWDGVKFSVLHPPPAFKSSKANDQSCVLLVESGNNSLLLSGDITIKSEKRLLDNYPELQVDLLQVPHHGSKSSSSEEWLSSISPQYAVFASGYSNPFRHPHPIIQKRYEELDIEHYTTWRTGALSFHLSQDAIKKTASHRQKHQRYWHYRAP